VEKQFGLMYIHACLLCCKWDSVTVMASILSGEASSLRVMRGSNAHMSLLLVLHAGLWHSVGTRLVAPHPASV